MPELPEVQTVCDVLRPQLTDRRITRIRVLNKSVLANRTAEALERDMCGRSVAAVHRRGKYISFLLDNGACLRVHLRMTGCLLIAPASMLVEKHTHVVFGLDNGQEMRFIDPRRFGRLWFFAKDEEDCVSGVHKLGPEPFDDVLDADYLKKKLGHTQRCIKDCLLDQTIVAGIGNIYSDEILLRAGIRPMKRACALTEDEMQRLSRCIPETMAYYVAKNVITPERYLQTGGRDYQNTPYLQVYGRAGKACVICGEMLQKATVAGRTSVFCARCQRLDENDEMR